MALFSRKKEENKIKWECYMEMIPGTEEQILNHCDKRQVKYEVVYNEAQDVSIIYFMQVHRPIVEEIAVMVLNQNNKKNSSGGIFSDDIFNDDLFESDYDVQPKEKSLKDKLAEFSAIAAEKEKKDATNAIDAKTNVSDMFGILTLEEQSYISSIQAKKDAAAERKKNKLGRNNQVKTRLTDEELIEFNKRVAASGKKQGDFMRDCLLNQEIIIKSATEYDSQAFQVLMGMASDLGRISGMIKQTVITNKEFNVLTETEKSELEKEIRELRKLRDEIQKEVTKLYGNS